MTAMPDKPPAPPVSPPAAPDIQIDGALVARSLGLDVARFRQLMAQRKIAILCERGVDDHAGLYRATFYYGKKRLRLVVDEHGRPVG